ncbi:MAG TPA: PLP-dependent aminotransferase family protein [Puia sp.]|jgi:GntR family transcriptional regulator/MocR family aminotransferase
MLPFDTLLPTDKTLALPVYQQVAQGMVQHIRNGVLKRGAMLPGTRELAGILNLHRKTVIAAYDELSAQGWIEAVPRRGFNVSSNLPEIKPQRWNAAYAFEKKMAAPFYMLTKGGFQFPVLSVPPPRLIIDDGHPDNRLAPMDLLVREYRSRLGSISRKQLSASLVAGSPRLREVMESYLAETRGMQASVPNILITHGAQMSIYIAASLLVREGDQVIVGEPGYYLANQVLESLGANLLRVPVDEEGIDVDAVEKLCRKLREGVGRRGSKGHGIKMLYLIPHHHHPTTVTLSPERRMRLLEIAEEFNFSIVEDDYDYDFHYSSSPYLPLAASSHNNRVIYIGSFSKSLSSSIRIGFMVGPEDFIGQAIYLRRLIELRGDNNMEDALAALIRNGDVGRHLKKVNRIYEVRRDRLCLLLDSKLGDAVSYSKPSGGMAVWTSFGKKYPLKAVAEKAAKQGLYISNGLMYNTHAAVYNAVRMGFAGLTEAEMEEAIAILADCV